jgi:hypothetical protein
MTPEQAAAWQDESFKALEDAERGINTPGHLYNRADLVQEMRTKVEASYLLTGRELPKPPSAMEIAEAQIDRKFAGMPAMDNLAPMIDGEVRKVLSLDPNAPGFDRAATRVFDEKTGEARDRTPDEMKALLDMRAANFPRKSSTSARRQSCNRWRTSSSTNALLSTIPPAPAIRRPRTPHNWRLRSNTTR